MSEILRLTRSARLLRSFHIASRASSARPVLTLQSCARCTARLFHAHTLQELLVSPQLLDQFMIPYVKLVHHPREFIIVAPGDHVISFRKTYVKISVPPPESLVVAPGDHVTLFRNQEDPCNRNPFV